MAEIKPRLPGQSQPAAAPKKGGAAAPAAPAAAAAATKSAHAASQTDGSSAQRPLAGPQAHAPRAATPLAGAFSAPGAQAKGASFSNPQAYRAREGSGERPKNDLETQAFLAEIKSRPAEGGGGVFGVFRRKSPALSAQERNELLAYKKSQSAVPELQRKLVAVDNLRAIDELIR